MNHQIEGSKNHKKQKKDPLAGAPGHRATIHPSQMSIKPADFEVVLQASAKESLKAVASKKTKKTKPTVKKKATSQTKMSLKAFSSASQMKRKKKKVITKAKKR